jgi:hypothetical protein
MLASPAAVGPGTVWFAGNTFTAAGNEGLPVLAAGAPGARRRHLLRKPPAARLAVTANSCRQIGEPGCGQQHSVPPVRRLARRIHAGGNPCRPTHGIE